MDIKSIGGGSMRIGVDAGCLGVKEEGLKVGVYNIVKQTLLEISKQDTKNTYFLYSFYPIDASLMRELGKNMKNIVVRPARGWMKLWLPFRLLLDRVDIFFAANQAVPLRLPGSGYKTIGVVYDIAFERYPELYAYAASVQKHRFYSKETAERSDIVIAISQRTKDDLVELYNTPKEKIHVAYPGIVPLPEVKPYKEQFPYFLYVGAFKKGKNIPTLLKAYMGMRKKSKKRMLLLMAGGTNWMDPEITKVITTIPSNIKSDIRMLGAVTDAKKLSSLYRGAIAFVCPSLYEGFGLPFVEAMSVGCPVVGSTRGSIPEIVGNAGMLVEPYDTKVLANSLEKIASDSTFRQTLSKRGKEQSKRYSFKTFAKAIYSAIENLA